jgi:hypothetical protein
VNPHPLSPLRQNSYHQSYPRFRPNRIKAESHRPMPQATSAVKGPPGKGSPTGYAPRLGLFSATMMVVGGIIGSGIFLNPAIVAERVGTAALTLTVWVLGGVVAVIGALIYAELGARRPVAGGGYVYLRMPMASCPHFSTPGRSCWSSRPAPLPPLR